jgi:hypothetical protein
VALLIILTTINRLITTQALLFSVRVRAILKEVLTEKRLSGETGWLWERPKQKGEGIDE